MSIKPRWDTCPPQYRGLYDQLLEGMQNQTPTLTFQVPEYEPITAINWWDPEPGMAASVSAREVVFTYLKYENDNYEWDTYYDQNAVFVTGPRRRIPGRAPRSPFDDYMAEITRVQQAMEQVYPRRYITATPERRLIEGRVATYEPLNNWWIAPNDLGGTQIWANEVVQDGTIESAPYEPPVEMPIRVSLHTNDTRENTNGGYARQRPVRFTPPRERQGARADMVINDEAITWNAPDGGLAGLINDDLVRSLRRALAGYPSQHHVPHRPSHRYG